MGGPAHHAQPGRRTLVRLHEGAPQPSATVTAPRLEPSPAEAGERLRTCLSWTAAVAAAFFAVYPATNWLTSLRATRLQLYLPAELRAPFVPAAIWVYLSMYVLFLAPLFRLPAARMPALGKQLIAGTLASGLAFLLLPTELGFERVLPDGSHAWLYALLFRLDRPHDLVPSLHVVFSATIALACADVSGPRARLALHAWLAAIALSTLLVHQHHLLDVASALALVHLLRLRIR